MERAIETLTEPLGRATQSVPTILGPAFVLAYTRMSRVRIRSRVCFTFVLMRRSSFDVVLTRRRLEEASTADRGIFKIHALPPSTRHSAHPGSNFSATDFVASWDYLDVMRECSTSPVDLREAGRMLSLEQRSDTHTLLADVKAIDSADKLVRSYTD